MSGPGTETSAGTTQPASVIVRGDCGAGIIGPAPLGPAFVPISVGTVADYQTVFGVDTTGEYFGQLAAEAWLESSNGVAFVRLLGVGDGKRRTKAMTTNSDGTALPVGGVKNAGFVVGSQLTASNGLLGHNPFANEGGPPGRTYFFGAFMSESAGSTYFSDAGIQALSPATVASKTLNVASRHMDGTDTLVITDGRGNTLTITIGTLAFDKTFVDSDFTVGGSPGAYTFAVTYNVLSVSSDTDYTEGLVNAIRAAAAYSTTSAKFFVTANEHSLGSTSVVLKAIEAGSLGNNATITATNVAGDPGIADDLGLTSATPVNLSGGSRGNGSVPILRGVLFAASGVLPALSGCYTGNASTASAGVAVGSFAAGQDGGSTIGAINMSNSSEKFVLLLNGHKNTDDFPSTITASFNPVAVGDAGHGLYFADVFNTDPTKIREAGHYLYTHFDIPSSLARVTGSTIVTAGTGKTDAASELLEESAFLVTSSLAYNPSDTAGSLSIPNFENFCDRFQTAKTPWIISQFQNRKQYNLFRFHARDDGHVGNNQIKITISNIIPPAQDGDYGSFDITIRSLENLDTSMTSITGMEEYPAVNLDPTSDNYILKVIGDSHYYYDFEHSVDRQRFVLDGTHGNFSRYVRAEVSSDINNQILPAKTLPAGFRGPYHLVTSGSSIMSIPQHPLSAGTVVAASTEWAHRITEPPIPYRLQLSDNEDVSDTSGQLFLDNNYCWGIQTTQPTNLKAPNKDTAYNDGFNSYLKYFPTFSTQRQKAWVGENNGAADSSGTVYDSDRYNNNLFTLENILVHTRSDADVVDETQWAYAKYRRNRTKIAMLDSTLQMKTGVRFYDFGKDLSTTAGSNTFAKFTVPMQGGFDGNNIFSREKEKFSNLAAYFEYSDANQGIKEAPTVSAYMSALKLLQEESETEMKVLAIPGIRIEQITNKAMSVAEERFDAIYVMDVEEVASGSGLVLTSSQEVPSPALTAERFTSRALDSSFVAAYFPDVSVFNEQRGVNVFVPPSVHVLRVYSRLDAESNVYAPAGTVRGKLSPPAVESKVKFYSTEKETIQKLYNAAINPIIQSSEGPIIFGQRTLYTLTESALQKVAVRRMVLEIRRYCRIVARSFLFEQNREEVLKLIQDEMVPILSRMVNVGGVTRYKVMVDASTTTQADIEANVVRGKVYLEPSSAEEVIQVDFST